MIIEAKNSEIRDQAHLMDAEGTSDEQPSINEIESFLAQKGWQPNDIDIWFDNMQGFWRWNCKIEMLKP